MGAELAAVLNDLRSGVARVYGENLVQLVLFGSHARGEAGPESDLDVLVVLRRGETRDEHEDMLDLVVDLNLRYGILVSHVCMLQADYDTRRGPFLRNVRREGMPV